MGGACEHIKEIWPLKAWHGSHHAERACIHTNTNYEVMFVSNEDVDGGTAPSPHMKAKEGKREGKRLD